MQPFIVEEFNTWKLGVDAKERELPQTERVNVRNTRDLHSDGGGYSYSYNYTTYSHSDSNVPYYNTVHGDANYNQASGYSHYDGWENWQDWPNRYHNDFVTTYYYHVDSNYYYTIYGGQNHSDSNTPSTQHSDTYHSHYDYYYHSDTGFDHNDFVPSKPSIFKADGAIVPSANRVTTLGFYSYDKNKDGFGGQTERSKTALYQVRIRQTKDLTGAAKVSAWRTLQTYNVAETYLLNTVDPLGTGNTDGKLTEGFYEIEVTAKNMEKTQGGVTQTFVSTVQTKEIKIQQNRDPEISVSNPNSFIDFTFGLENVRTKSGAILDYNKYATDYNLDKYNGILANIIVTEKDKDQYLKGTGWIETSTGAKIAGTEFDLVWENGLKSIKTDGIVDITAQLFIPHSSFKSLPSGSGYNVVIQVKDYLDAACTTSAGATITQKTVSKLNTTKLTVAMDMVLPVAIFEISNGAWNKDKLINVKFTDDFIGVDRWRYRILTGGTETTPWSTYRTTTSENINLPETGSNIVEVEVIDKAGNKTIAVSNEFKVDKKLPTLGFILNPTGWTYGNVTITAKGTDTESGVKRVQKPDGTWIAGDTATHTVNVNGVYNFVVEDNVGNIYEDSINITNIDDIIPEPYEVRAINVGNDFIELEISDAKDLQSGLHETPYRLSKDNGATWTGWQAGTKYRFTGLNVNQTYNMKVQVRDKALNMREAPISVATVTKDIILGYSKIEGSNQVNLNVNLNGNPIGTEVMITRQNMSTNELVVIKDWSTGLQHNDRVPTFITGYRYSAYARNKDKVIGNAASVIIKEIEEPAIEIKGYVTDKYLYDSATQTLILFGNASGNIEINAKTLATDKLYYSITDDVGRVVKEGDLYGRVGEYRYSINTPISKVKKEVLNLSLKGEYTNQETQEVEVKDLKVPNKKITVYRVESLRDLINVNITPNGENLSVGYTGKTSFANPADMELSNNLALRDLLASLDMYTTNTPQNVLKGVNVVLPQGDLTLEKQMGGGLYKETFKQNSVLITTNISSFVTNLNESWSLEVYVTSSTGKFTLPRDMAKFTEAGYKLEVYYADGKSNINGTTQALKFEDVKASGSVWNIASDTFNSVKMGAFGVKVTEVMPTYHTQNINLQTEESASATTLDVIGNSNIKYDKTFIFNRMNNIMKSHNEVLYNSTTNNWEGSIYYRTGVSNNLVLITGSKIKVISPSTLEEMTSKLQANTGSVTFVNNLYMGTSEGLKLVNESGNVSNTSFIKSINAMVADGLELFIGSNEGLHILDSQLREIQFIPNSELTGLTGTIKSIHIANGNIYLSSDVKGNTYVVLSK